MALVINTNIASINAQRNLARTEGAMQTSMARLSSGMRITSAKDDAAGLSISENLRAQIRGFAQAERNANDGMSLIQTAEGALNEVSGALIRMRELAVQSATGTLGNDERKYVNAEFQDLLSEINRIASVTEFNGTKLLNGSQSTGITFQVGINNVADDRITASIGATIGSTYASKLGDNLGGGTSALQNQSLSAVSKAQKSLGFIDQAIKDISGVRGDLGAIQNRLAITVNNLATQRENLSAANSRIRDVDVAHESVEMTRNQILMQAGVSVLAQANQLPGLALSLLG
ncbi:MAG: flagellin FliC [Myxococcota bacterium]|jgi:flagellin|nr:flagellin FliC [Myxococcota bacterium]